MPAPTSFVDSSQYGNSGIASILIDESRILEFDFSINGDDEFSIISTIYDDTSFSNDGITDNSRLAPFMLKPFFIKNNSFVLQWTKVADAIIYIVDVSDTDTFTVPVSTYYDGKQTSATNLGVVGDIIASNTNLYARVRAFVDTVNSFYSNTVNIVKSVGASYGTRASFIDFYKSNEIDSSWQLPSDSDNGGSPRYDLTVTQDTVFTDKLAIQYEQISTLPNNSSLPYQLLDGDYGDGSLTEWTFCIRAKFNGINSSGGNVFISNLSNINDLFKFEINSGVFYIKKGASSYPFPLFTMPINDDLERIIVLQYNKNIASGTFDLYVDDMSVPASTLIMTTYIDWSGSPIFIGSSIDTTPLPLINTSLNATVCNIAFYSHELTLSERNNYVAIPSRI